jgi:predicted alpha/beta superfamily hydrolase
MNNCLRLIASIYLLLTASYSNADSIDPKLIPALGNVKYHELKSEILGRPFHIFVDLPEDYDSGNGLYPTIYLLDGGVTFPLMAAYHHYLFLGEETPAAILVGISYGGSTYEEGNYRSTDFTAPSEERSFWGGAGLFQQVLKEELLPLIEVNYRSDPKHRVIFGQSLGGQFVLYNALTRPELFYGHIASNPALHRNLPFFLRWHGDEPMPTSPGRVFVASGEDDDERFREPAMKWIEFWQGTSARPWQLETRTLEGQSHFSAAPLAFRQGLAWIFSTQ